MVVANKSGTKDNILRAGVLCRATELRYDKAKLREFPMEIPVLLEKVKGDGYRARGKEPFVVSARGATREEALAKLRAKIRTRLKKGSEIVALEVGPELHPLARFAGMFKDDPDFEDVLKIMADSRKRMDENPDIQ
jgi:hypothetical protein